MKGLPRWCPCIEKVSTATCDRGRSISSLRVPYAGDKAQVISKDMVLAENIRFVRCRENIENVPTTSGDRGRSIFALRVTRDGDRVQVSSQDMVLAENFMVKTLGKY